MNLQILHALGIADCAIFKRNSASSFELQEYAGEWIHALFPSAQSSERIDVCSDSGSIGGRDVVFLNDFLIDAETFWQTQDTGQIKSGIWTEQLSQSVLFLEAFACCYENDNYLIIKNVEKTYFERKETLQVARELSLSNSQTIERHDYLHDRLQEILLDRDVSNITLPLNEAIRYAGIGIMIIDEHKTVMLSNPAISAIFDSVSLMNSDQIFAKLSELVARQYPEKPSLCGIRPWQGEVYWHAPPLGKKWLNTNIHPVMSAEGRVKHWIVSISDQTKIKQLLQTNEELALHDPLTGLPNRQFFWQQLQACIAQEDPFYLISIDIVNFKYTNDLYGYSQGDELLKKIAYKITKFLAKRDFITRFGADEFMIIRQFSAATLHLAQTTFENDTFNFAKRLSETCSQPFTTADGRQCDLAIKIGMTQYPQDASKPEALLNNADLALNYAKMSANTSVQVYNNALKEVSVRRLMLEEALKQAIANNELEIYLQPIYDINTKQVIKAEALLRWQLGDEQVMPYEFIPIAESSDLINAVGRWVISNACKIVRQFSDNGITLPVSVNFSPKQIYDANLLTFISETIKKTQIDPHLLEFEVTEGVLIKNYQKVSNFLHELKRHGVSISVDDFGTGYSSLAYLKHLPIDSLKIDRTFIQDVDFNDDDSAIVSAIIALAKQLRLGVVAEGIENEGQIKFLVEHECLFAQGFYYAKPMPVDDFFEFTKNVPSGAH